MHRFACMLFLSMVLGCSSDIVEHTDVNDMATSDAAKPGLVFRKPQVNFLSRDSKQVRISSDKAFFSAGMISFKGNVLIRPLAEPNVKKITSHEGIITSPDKAGYIKLAPNMSLDSGSELELSGNVIAYLADGKLQTEQLFFKLKERQLWSETLAVYKGSRGFLKSKDGFVFNSQKDTLDLNGPTEGVLNESP